MNVGIMCSSKETASLNSRLNNATVASVIAMKDYSFIMGAATSGSMGNIKEILKDSNRKLTIVGNEFEVQRVDADRKIIANSTFERTKKIYENSDVIIFLDGGIGTLAEITSCLSNKIETEDDKILILYNETGCFDYLLKDLERKNRNGLIDNFYDRYFDVNNNLEELANSLEKAENRFIKRGEIKNERKK